MLLLIVVGESVANGQLSGDTQSLTIYAPTCLPVDAETILLLHHDQTGDDMLRHRLSTKIC